MARPIGRPKKLKELVKTSIVLDAYHIEFAKTQPETLSELVRMGLDMIIEKRKQLFPTKPHR